MAEKKETKDKLIEESPTLRDTIEETFDELLGKGENNEESGSGEFEDGGDVLGESGDLEDEDERSGEPTGSEAELGVEEEEGAVDEDDGAVEADDGLQEEEGEDEEEGEEGREESEEIDPAVTSLDPLEYWPDDVKAAFVDMPSKAQEFFMRSYKGMQADYTQKVQSVADIHKAIDPVREELAKTGVSEGEMIRRFVAVHKRLEDDPAAAVKWIAELYGVDASGVVTDKPAASPADDRVSALEERISVQDQRAAIEHAHAVNSEVVKLREEGKMPLYEEAEPLMIQVVQSAQASGQTVPSVMEIYEHVVWSNPTLREKHLAKSDLEKKRQKVVEKKKNVAKSKRAAGKRRSTKSPTAGEVRTPVTLRDELSQRLDEAMRAK